MSTGIVSVIVLGVLIFFHELGHFLFAKWCGVGVIEFAVGFGPKLWSRRFGETIYSLRAIPLGGFVRMVGESPELLGADAKLDAPADPIEQRLLEDRNKWFVLKGVLPKSAIVLAGPGFNFLLAILLGIVSFWTFGVATPLDLPIIGDTIPGHPAEIAGLKSGDVVKSVNGWHPTTWAELAERVTGSGGKALTLDIEREVEGKPTQLQIVVAGAPESAEMAILNDDQKPPKENQVKIGIMPQSERVAVGLIEGTKLSFVHTWFLTKITVKGLFGMVRGAISPDNIAGPIFIFREAARSAKRGVEHVFDFMIFLSVSLAVLNLLPIPVLDGGHLLFFVIEAVKGSPLNLRVQQIATQFGMFALLLLMVFALGNDIFRLTK